MKIYYVPINLNEFNPLNLSIGEVEDFAYTEGMMEGDCLLLYFSQTGIDKFKKNNPAEYEKFPIEKSGFYMIARVKGGPYTSEKETDYLCGREVIDAEITHVDKNSPIVPYTVNSGWTYTEAKEISICVEF